MFPLLERKWWACLVKWVYIPLFDLYIFKRGLGTLPFDNLSREICLTWPSTFSISYMSSIKRWPHATLMPPSCHPHATLMPPYATLEWHATPCRSGLTFLIWQVSYDHTLSGTTCQLSNMIDWPSPPWGRGREAPRAPLKKVWGACGPPGYNYPIHISSVKKNIYHPRYHISVLPLVPRVPCTTSIPTWVPLPSLPQLTGWLV